MEPVEEATVEVPDEYTGAITSEFGRRSGQLVETKPTGNGTTQFVYNIPTRALLGIRNQLLTATKGTLIMNTLLHGYQPMGTPLAKLRNGVLISAETGPAITYSLLVVEEREPPCSARARSSTRG